MCMCVYISIYIYDIYIYIYCLSRNGCSSRLATHGYPRLLILFFKGWPPTATCCCFGCCCCCCQRFLLLLLLPPTPSPWLATHSYLLLLLSDAPPATHTTCHLIHCTTRLCSISIIVYEFRVHFLRCRQYVHKCEADFAQMPSVRVQFLDTIF